ncbi:phosphoribosylaminoimidazolesuccinocarboxamide synthase, partial [bacterium]
GSLYKEYLALGERGTGHRELHGIGFPDDLREGELLPEAIFTPATKAEAGHDENISFEAAANLVGIEIAEIVRDRTLNLYRRAAAHASANGLILADTKFEFGLVDEGVILIDEALTPDSSRYWDAALYAPGGSPPSFDKQFLRDFLEGSGWDKTPPGPELPADVVAGTRERYAEAYRRITGAAFSQGTEDR